MAASLLEVAAYTFWGSKACKFDGTDILSMAAGQVDFRPMASNAVAIYPYLAFAHRAHVQSQGLISFRSIKCGLDNTKNVVSENILLRLSTE
nr:hypothetical protein Iba_chr03aCG19990 [Ipomoea batatas]GMC74816.1 hypothetical protein Iba_chr03cCG13650 [Ipomoea batatas]GMC76028.1 hypothetical protein Iba_chr03dCG10410 [Ipomoea batatas]